MAEDIVHTAETGTKAGYKITKTGRTLEDWNYFEFDEIAKRSDRRSNPQTRNKKFPCIELEHINQNEGSINGYVCSSEQKSSKNHFKQGDVLFGKLRPYLRKYWLAEFEGLCSSEIWVLKPLEKIVSQEYLFYLIQQHRFIQIANVTSGSKCPELIGTSSANIHF